MGLKVGLAMKNRDTDQPQSKFYYGISYVEISLSAVNLSFSIFSVSCGWAYLGFLSVGWSFGFYSPVQRSATFLGINQFSFVRIQSLGIMGLFCVSW